MSILQGVVRIGQREIKRKQDSATYFNDPSAWSQYMLGITLWSKQAEIAKSVVHNKSVAVKAGHGVGKSWLAAILIVWWIDTRYPAAFVASTAPSQAQISAIVWRYVRQLKSLVDTRYKEGLVDHKLPGYITSDNQWKEDGGVILGFGRKPPDNKEDDSFQGLHDGYVLAIGDEAVGLSESMIDALGNITSNENSRRVLIANPTNPGSYLGKLFREKVENWEYHTISVLDSPNFKEGGEGLDPEALEKLVGPQYVADKKKEYGETSARFKARVLGEFAWDLGDTLITPEIIATATDAEITPDSESLITLGVDVARFGKDLSVIYLNQGGRLRMLKSFDYNTLTELVAFVHKAALDNGVHEVRYDVSGVGQGFEDLMWLEEVRPYKMIGMNASGASPDRRQWHNARAWWWDSVRKMLRDGEVDIDGSDERLVDELMSVQYKFNAQSGGLLIESKDDMKKRGMKSPDFADAAIYACFDVNKVQEDVKPPTKIHEAPEDILDSMPSYLNLLVQSW